MVDEVVEVAVEAVATEVVEVDSEVVIKHGHQKTVALQWDYILDLGYK